MFWTSVVFVGLAGVLTLFVVATDGRYFGKKMAFVVYDRLGPIFFFSHHNGDRWDQIARGLSLNDAEAILDVGTATGGLPISIASDPEFRGQVTGIDWSPRMISIARKKARLSDIDGKAVFRVVDARGSLPFPDSKFDVIFCLGVLETMSKPELVLGELRRVLKRDGVLVFSVYRGWTSLGFSLGYDWYMQNLEAHGLKKLNLVASRRSHDLILARAAAENRDGLKSRNRQPFSAVAHQADQRSWAR